MKQNHAEYPIHNKLIPKFMWRSLGKAFKISFGERIMTPRQ